MTDKTDITFEDGATFEYRGLTMTLGVETDTDVPPDHYGLGNYTHEEEGAIARKDGGHHVARGEYLYFKPGMTEEEHIKAGATPEQARKYVLQDLDRAEGCNRGDWCFLNLRVVAFHNGREVGAASTGGINSDASDSFLMDVVSELAREAAHEARETVRELEREKELEELRERALRLVIRAADGGDIQEDARAIAKEHAHLTAL